MSDNLLFSASLLTPLPALASDFNIRPLSIDDFNKGMRHIKQIYNINTQLSLCGIIAAAKVFLRFNLTHRSIFLQG